MNFKLFKQIAADNIILKDMNFISELNMEAFLIENPQLLTTDEYSEVKIIFNQLHVVDGRNSKGTAGRIDLISVIDNKYVAIIELKNDTIKNEHLNQLIDYLNCFLKNKKPFLKNINSQNDTHGDEILGFIVGTDITPEVKTILLKGNIVKDVQIIGITINRYSTPDNKEVYILSETYAPTKSDYYKIRFNSWNEFNNYQKNEKKVTDKTLKIAKLINDKITKLFNLSLDNINYAKTAFTFNVPINKRRTIFAYVKVHKNRMQIYMDYDVKIPRDGHQNTDKRFPNTYFINITDENHVNDELFKNIEKSFELVSRQ